jgi:hypothetical protein
VGRLRTCDLADYFVCAKVDYFNSRIVLCRKEQPLARKVHLKVVEIAIMEARQRNCLNKFQRLIDRNLGLRFERK